MKRVIFAIAAASASLSGSANVFLPNIGIDGWNSDNLYFRSAVLSQGHLTLSNAQNHTINPAYSLQRVHSAEARMESNGAFSGGVFMPLIGQSLGVYFGRNTEDGNLYRLDTSGSGDFDTDVDLSGAVGAPSNLMDVYWASGFGFGQLGARLNLRSAGFSGEADMQNEDTSLTARYNLTEVHTTLGWVSDDLPLEVTAHLGLPFGGYEEASENSAANTEAREEIRIDSAFRWALTASHRLDHNSHATTLFSGFIGGSRASYRYESSSSAAGSASVNTDLTSVQQRLAMGLIGSHRLTVNERTDLTASAGLTRTSWLVGTVNHLPDPSEPNYVRRVSYELPVAVGLEFSASEHTVLLGSLSSNLFNSFSGTSQVNDDGSTANEATGTLRNDFPATQVNFGLSYELVPRLKTNLLISQDLFNSGFGGDLVSRAELKYGF